MDLACVSGLQIIFTKGGIILKKSGCQACPLATSLSFTWELDINAILRSHHRNTDSNALGVWGPVIYVLTSPPGDSETC